MTTEEKLRNERKTALRKELESWVVACNKYLREAVKEMDWIILLRNMHPSYRADYARQLREERIITDEQAREFTVILQRR